MRTRADFTLNKTYTRILIGHSHPECAFDADLIPGFRNLARSGESPFYSYQKLKRILKQNPQIDTVLIEFTNNMIPLSKNKWIWGQEKMNRFLPAFAPFMSTSDFLLLAKNNPRVFIQSLLISTRTNLRNLLSNRTDYADFIGGYFRLEAEKVPGLISELANKPAARKIDLTNYSISQTSLEYVRKMVHLCREQNLNVLLVRSPQHSLFDDRENEEIFTQLREEFFGELPFLDFNNFPLTDHEFADFGHLNYRGAQKFTLWFRELVKQGLLEQEDPAGFLQNELPKQPILYVPPAS